MEKLEAQMADLQQGVEAQVYLSVHGQRERGPFSIFGLFALPVFRFSWGSHAI